MRCPTHGLRDDRSSTGGFTLVELLAVIFIIGVVTALLLPALSRARSRSQSVACMDNMRQLALSQHLYTTDFNDYFAPNDTISIFNYLAANSSSSKQNLTAMSWLPDDDAMTESNPSNIISGVLYQYNQSLPVYHCPADLALLQTADGRPLNRSLPGAAGAMSSSSTTVGQSTSQLRWRSYNMSQSVNGYPQGDPQYNAYIPTWTRFTDVRHPRPSELFVFIDENSQTMMDAQFGAPPLGSTVFWPNVWWDMPSDRHMQGANLTFVDGHAEHWNWVYPKNAYQMGQGVSAKEMPDYLRVQGAMKQLSDN